MPQIIRLRTPTLEDCMNRFLNVITLSLLAALIAGCGQILMGVEDREATTQPHGESPLDSGSIPSARAETPAQTGTPAPTPEPSPYWQVVEDPRTGLRFAIPCFWRAEIPSGEQDPTGLGAFAVRNFDDEYAMSFARSAIPDDAGAVKIDMLYWQTTDFGVSPGTDLTELKLEQFFGPESEILALESIQVNAQPALHVVTESLFGVSDLYLMRMSDDLVFGFAPAFTVDHPDIAGVLNSIAVEPETTVKIPSARPAPPPIGVAAPCVPEYAVALEPTQALTEENTTCGLYSYRSLERLTGMVTTYLQDGNMGGLVFEHLINDPFVVGYWLSESLTLSPQEAGTTIANSLPSQERDAGELTFTTDQGAFPSLAETSPENLFGPDLEVAEIVFSEGWGTDGRGAALLYFGRDECSGYYWHGLIFSADAFGG